VIRFIDEHRDRRIEAGLRWGIGPIAKVLGIAPSTYHAAKKRPPSARAMRDAALKPEILRVWGQNLSVYGADKISGTSGTRTTSESPVAPWSG